MPHQPIEETDLYKRVVNAADEIFAISQKLKPVDQNLVGNQLIRAIDSVRANLVEGDALYTEPDTIRSFVIARASAREALYWIEQCQVRKLIPAETCNMLHADISRSLQMLNGLIRHRRSGTASSV